MDLDVVDHRATLATIDPDQFLNGLDRIAALPNLDRPAVLHNILGTEVVFDGTFEQTLMDFGGVRYEGHYSFSRYRTRPTRSESAFHDSVIIATNSSSTGYRPIRLVDITIRNFQDIGCLPVQNLIPREKSRSWKYLPNPDGGGGSYVLRLNRGRLSTFVMVEGDAHTGCINAVRIGQEGTGRV